MIHRRYARKLENVYLLSSKEIVIYIEENLNLGPTKTRALILDCRLWRPSENTGTDSGTALHSPAEQ